MNRFWKIGALVVGIIFNGVGALADPAAPPSVPGSSGAGTVPLRRADETYRLQPGDELEFNVFSLPSTDKRYVIRVDGGFYHPVIGEVKAAGLTLAQLRALLKKRLAKELKNPSFQVGLTNYARADVSVLGEVKTQGKFTIGPGTTVLDLLAMAGGLGENADPDLATLIRNGKHIPIRLRALSAGGTDLESRTTEVQAGDILYVQPGYRISVAGEVQKAGVYPVSHSSTNVIADALKGAGGVKGTGAVHRIKIIRPSLHEPIIVDGSPPPGGPPQPALEDGDTIVVPVRQAIVLGTVAKQGPVPLEGGESLIDVVSQGGLSGDSDLGRITVARYKDVLAGSGVREVYNIRDYFQQKKGKDGKPLPTPKVVVDDGDVVYVPSHKQGDSVGTQFQNASYLLLMLREFL